MRNKSTPEGWNLWIFFMFCERKGSVVGGWDKLGEVERDNRWPPALNLKISSVKIVIFF